MLKNNSLFWDKKSLIWHFAISDLKTRYRNSVLGFLWNFLEPLLLLFVLYIVFTNIFNNEIEHFPLYLLLGLIMWNMVSKSTQMALTSIINRESILTQINIPHSILPISVALTALIMFSFEMIIFGVFLAAFQFVPPITILLLPLIIILQFILVLGLSLPLSVLNAKFRDIQYIWGIILHAGFFLHPIFYKIEILPEILQEILVFSPMVQMLNISRNVSLYGELPSLNDVVLMVTVTFIIFFIGIGIYKKFSYNLIEEL